MDIDSDSDSDSVSDDVSFDSSDDEAIIYRMELAERRRRKKKRRTTRGNEKKMVNNQQLKPPHAHHPLPVRDNDDGIVEQNNKLSTIVAVEANIVCETAILTPQVQPVASQQQQRQLLLSSTTSTTNGSKSNANINDSVKIVSSLRKRKRYTIRLDNWMEMYQRLIAYKKEHDDSTKVPRNYKKDPTLGQWVATQRIFNNNNKLLPDRYSLLDSIDFDWGNGSRGQNTDWMETYQRLVVYKKQHSNTIVPFTYKEDPKLGRWVAKQRMEYKNKSIKEERASLLDSIGFDWRDKRGRRINTSKTTDEVPVPPPTCTGKVVRTHHFCAPNDRTNAAVSSSITTSSRSSLPSQHRPIFDDSSDDDDDDDDIIII